MAVDTLIQLRRGTEAEWNSAAGTLGHGILYQGEIGYATDSRRFKVGDGITHWASGLSYAAIVPSGFIANSGINLSLGANGSSLTIGVTGLNSSYISDFGSAVSGIVTSISVSPEEILDIIGSGLSGASGIGIDYRDDLNTIYVNVTGITASQVTNFNSSVSGLLPNITGTSGVSVGFNNNTYTVSLLDPTIQSTDITDFNSAVSGLLNVTSITAGTGIGVTNNSGNHTISVTGVLASLVTDFNEAVEDAIGLNAGSTGFIRNGTGVNWTYDDGNDTLTANVSGVSLSGHTHTLSEITDVTASSTEVNYLDGSIPGTGVAGKAVVLDNSLNIVNIGNISTTGTVTVGGNLVVNGTTTTVNSTVTTLDDPILTLGGDTAPAVDDNKDRGIEFRYHDGVSAKLGFFGFDDSTGKFTFIPNATNTSEVFGGSIGEIDAKLDWNNINNVPDPIVNVNLSGAINGSGNTTLNNLSGTFDVNINTILQSGIPVNYLTASGITLGSTTVNLGQTSNRIDGLVAISGVSAASPTVLTFCVIDGGSP